MTQTWRPSVTGDGDDMFCLFPMRLPADRGRFHETACVFRSTAQSSMPPVARAVATFRKMRSSQMMGVDPLKAGRGSFHATFSVALQVVGRPVSLLTPLSEGPRHCGQLSARRDTPATAIRSTAVIGNRRDMSFSVDRVYACNEVCREHEPGM